MASLIRDIVDGMGKKRKEIGAADMIRGRSWEGCLASLYHTHTHLSNKFFHSVFKIFSHYLKGTVPIFVSKFPSKEHFQFSFQKSSQNRSQWPHDPIPLVSWIN